VTTTKKPVNSVKNGVETVKGALYTTAAAFKHVEMMLASACASADVSPREGLRALRIFPQYLHKEDPKTSEDFGNKTMFRLLASQVLHQVCVGSQSALARLGATLTNVASSVVPSGVVQICTLVMKSAAKKAKAAKKIAQRIEGLLLEHDYGADKALFRADIKDRAITLLSDQLKLAAVAKVARLPEKIAGDETIPDDGEEEEAASERELFGEQQGEAFFGSAQDIIGGWTVDGDGEKSVLDFYSDLLEKYLSAG